MNAVRTTKSSSNCEDFIPPRRPHVAKQTGESALTLPGRRGLHGKGAQGSATHVVRMVVPDGDGHVRPVYEISRDSVAVGAATATPHVVLIVQVVHSVHLRTVRVEAYHGRKTVCTSRTTGWARRTGSNTGPFGSFCAAEAVPRVTRVHFRTKHDRTRGHCDA